MTSTKLWFGLGVEAGVTDVPDLIRHVSRADRGGLDLVTLSDHPYFPDRVDAYAALGFILGHTTKISAAVNVTNVPSRPAPMLARTVSGLSALSGGRVVLGIGAGGLWDDIAKLGLRTLAPGDAVRAMEEAILIVRALTGGATEPVFFDGEFYQVAGAIPAAAPTPPIWTGSLGPKSLTVTGKLADGWIPGHAADWLSQRYAQSRPVIDEAAKETGRHPEDIATIYNFPGRITETPTRHPRGEDGRWVGGSVDQWISELTGAVLEHRAGGFTYFPTSANTDRASDLWTAEIVPAVREATS